MPLRFVLAFLFASCLSFGQNLVGSLWRAHWIATADSSPRDYGVYHFRRTFDLGKVPQKLQIHVSADQRYRLFVNGHDVGEGPARGDLNHWRFETYDIAPHLNSGKNTIAAVVWNQGPTPDAPLAQVTFRTAFLLMADDETYKFLDTGDTGWKSTRNQAYSGIPVRMGVDVAGYWAAGMSDRVDAAKFPFGWQKIEFDDANWSQTKRLGVAAGREARDPHSRWMLVPRPIPMMEKRPVRLSRVRRTSTPVPDGFPKRAVDVSIPANSEQTILLDQDLLITGYPELLLSGGKGSSIKVGYAESLYEPDATVPKAKKRHRDSIALDDGKPMQFIGYFDEFLPDGTAQRMFRPLWWRTWRYLQISIKTAEDPLTIHDLRAESSMYPFEQKATFRSSDPDLDKILEIGWRAARLCAHEHYMDCPYYEQLQYAGDTRIQALVTLYQTGDTRMVRNAIEQIDESRTAEGLTYSRAPSEVQQYIPGFSLWWIGMLHDYMRYVDDPEFVRQHLPGVRQVLSWWSSRQGPEKLVKRLPWWPYVDWVDSWNRGSPEMDKSGHASVHDLQLLLAYQYAGDLERQYGLAPLADLYRDESSKLGLAIRRRYWDMSRGLFADNGDHKQFSQQANAMAVLADLPGPSHNRSVVERTLADGSLASASVYFKAYLHDAVKKAGLGDRYPALLQEWRDHLKNGLTTTPEKGGMTRSDCHAWGASPNYNVFRLILGIDSAAPGFAKVLIAPSLGDLEFAEGSMPHPKGTIRVSLKRMGTALRYEIETPVAGELVLGKQRVWLKAGRSSGQI